MALRILLVDDEPIVRQTLGDFLRELGHQVEECSDGEAAWQNLGAVAYDLALVDLRLPGMDGLTLLTKAVDLHPNLAVVLITGHGTMETAIQALRLGAADFLTKPVELLVLEGVLEKVMRLQTLRREGRHLRQTIRGLQAAETLRARNRWFVGLSQAAEQVRAQIRQAVEMDCQTILITGETGTGKEIVARQLHFHACADEKPFIVVNCPALPAELVESELFGHVKGAFTGAVADRAGSFELADGGTLLLDEVADLSAAAQAKLLRVLESRTFQRVGGSREIHVDLRVVAATNTSLEALVEEKKFRQDLFFRLNTYPIHLLPLRERPEDILPLAEHFLSHYASQKGLYCKGFSAAVQEQLLRYSFPGNSRELRYLVERAAMLCRTGQIQPEHLSFPAKGRFPAGAPPAEEGERARIVQALEAAHWNRRQAAKALGLPYSTLRYKIRQFGIR